MTKLYLSGEWQLDTNSRVLSRISSRLESGVEALGDELVEKVWQGTSVSESAINWTIAQLRKSLGDNQSPRKYIQTLSKKGYFWLPPVEVQSVHKKATKEKVEKDGFESNSTEESRTEESSTEKGGTGTLSENKTALKLARMAGLFILTVSIFIGITYLVVDKKEERDTLDSIRLTGIAKPFTSMTGAETNPSFSPDGNWLAFIHYNGKIREARVMIKALKEDASFINYDNQNQPSSKSVVSNRAQTAIHVGESAELISSIAWAPHSKQLAYMARNEQGCFIRLITFNKEMKGVKERIIHNCHSDGYSQLSWGKDPQTLFFSDRVGSGRYTIFQYDLKLASAKHLKELENVSDDIFLFRVSPVKDEILYVRNVESKRSKFILFDINAGGQEMLFERGGMYFDIDWNADGTAFFFNQSQQNLFQYNIASKKIELIYSQSGAEVYGLTQSPDQNQFAFVSASTNNNRIDLIDLTVNASQPQVMVDSSFQESMPQFSDDGDTLYFLSDRTGIPQIWKRSQDAQEAQVSNITEFMAIGTLSVSSDGNHLVGESDFNVRSIDLSSESSWIHNQKGTKAANPVFINQGAEIVYAKFINRRWQLVKVPYNEHLQESEVITKEGGYYSAYDGDDTLFFAKKAECGIYFLALSTRNISKLDDRVCVANNSFFFRNGYLFFEERNLSSRGIFRMSIKDKIKERILDRFKFPGSGFSVDKKRAQLAFHRRLSPQSDIFIIQN